MEDWKYQPSRDLSLTLSERHRSLHREGTLAHLVMRWCWWTSMRAALSVCNRLEIHGAEHLPRDPSFMLVANHASHLDAMVLGAAIPWRIRHRIFPLAAKDTFFETPVTAAFAANMLNALPVNREACGPHDIKALRRRLVEEPSIYLLFPEGTRSRTGVMSTFQMGVGMLTAETPVPVLPCYLEGTFAAFPPDRRWPRPCKLRVRIGPPMHFGEVRNRRAGWQQITEQLESAVRQLASPSSAEST